MNRLRPLYKIAVASLKPSKCEVTYLQQFRVNPITFFKANRMSTGQDDASKIVTYEDVISFKEKPNVLLIDVREPNELQETGVLPASINIPLADVEKALKNTSAEEFKNKYGRDLPGKDMELVFSCKLGGRAKKAMDSAIQLGYQNSKFYKGSWTDYASRQ